jgi:hypothetical protein
MTVEVFIPDFAPGGFAFGNADPNQAHAMRDAVAKHFDIEAPPAGAIFELELTMDEARDLIKWIGQHFPTTKGTTLAKKAAMTQPASDTRH